MEIINVFSVIFDQFNAYLQNKMHIKKTKKKNWQCVCVYIYIYVCVCVCVCLYTYIYIYVCVCVCVCVYTHIYSLWGKSKKYIYKNEMQLSANTFSQVGIPQIYEKNCSNCVNCMKQEKHSLTNILQTVNRLKKSYLTACPYSTHYVSLDGAVDLMHVDGTMQTL